MGLVTIIEQVQAAWREKGLQNSPLLNSSLWQIAS
jgi:hypothetical protein